MRFMRRTEDEIIKRIENTLVRIEDEINEQDR